MFRKLVLMVLSTALLTGSLAAEPLRIGVMPKLIGIDYFNACQRGVLEAAEELGVEVVYDGPDSNDVSRQTAMVETWIARRFDVICVAPNDPDAISPALRKARQRGIKVITWDADADPDCRDVFVNQATADGIAKALLDTLAAEVGSDASYINLTGSLTAHNQNVWMAAMERYRQQQYPNMKNLSETPKATQEDQAVAMQVTLDTLKSYPDVQGLFALTSVALPGAAEALKKSQKADQVFLTGLSTPNSMRTYIKEGIVRKMILWNPVDLGYLTVHVAHQLATGELTGNTITAGRLGSIAVEDGEVLLGPPLVFDKDNIDDFDF